MYPELFTLHFANKTFIIMSYSFFYSLAVIFVVSGSFWIARKNKFTFKQIFFLLSTLVVSGFIGARLLHFIFNPEMYANGNLQLFDLHMRGFTIVGGLLFSIITGFIIGKVYQINIWRFGDITIPFVAGGIGIARMGCFLNGCCYGHITKMPWGVKFPILSLAHQYQISHGLSNIFVVLRVHPTQIYEMLYAGIGGIIVILINRKKVFDGAGILFFGMWFSLFRILNTYFRQLPESLILSETQYTIIYLIIFTGCLSIFLYKYKKIKNKK